MAEQKRPEISPSQVVAGALAAVSAAVAASFLGVYGTLVGAGLMSVISTVGAAVYQHYLRRTSSRLRRLRGDGQATLTSAGSGLWSQLRHPTRWKAIAGGTVAVFGVALAVITVVELIANKPMFTLVTGHPSGSGPTVVKAVEGGGGRPGLPGRKRGGGGGPGATPTPSRAPEPTSTRAPTPGEESTRTPTGTPTTGAPTTPPGPGRPARPPQPQQEQPEGQQPEQGQPQQGQLQQGQPPQDDPQPGEPRQAEP